MKKFLILVIAMSVFVIFNSNDAFAGIPAPDGMVWVSSSGQTFANGNRVSTQPITNGLRVKCDDDNSVCCWEITDGGKNLELYNVSVPAKPGPTEASDTEIVAVPEPPTGNN